MSIWYTQGHSTCIDEAIGAALNLVGSTRKFSSEQLSAQVLQRVRASELLAVGALHGGRRDVDRVRRRPLMAARPKVLLVAKEVVGGAGEVTTNSAPDEALCLVLE